MWNFIPIKLLLKCTTHFQFYENAYRKLPENLTSNNSANIYKNMVILLGRSPHKHFFFSNKLLKLTKKEKMAILFHQISKYSPKFFFCRLCFSTGTISSVNDGKR